jgi:membrane protease subunit HflK
MFGEFQEEKHAVFRNLDRIFLGMLLILFLLYLASGIYVVQANEEGILRRFGAIKKETIKPGIHYRIPWPVDRVDRVKIKEVKRIEVGFWPEASSGYTIILPYCITGDRNIIHNQFVIQYRIIDPVRYRFQAVDPEGLLLELANAAVIEVVARRSVDPVLTTGKRDVELEVLKHLQAALDQEQLGISIASIETKLVEPPRTVSEAFKDVINAREEKSTLIHEAENYRNKVIPEAKAEAKRIMEGAEAFRYKRVSAAKGESERFLRIYEKYKAAPSLIRDRMFLQMMEEILPRTKIYVLAKDAQGRPIQIKLIRGALPTLPQIPSSEP